MERAARGRPRTRRRAPRLPRRRSGRRRGSRRRRGRRRQATRGSGEAAPGGRSSGRRPRSAGRRGGSRSGRKDTASWPRRGRKHRMTSRRSFPISACCSVSTVRGRCPRAAAERSSSSATQSSSPSWEGARPLAGPARPAPRSAATSGSCAAQDPGRRRDRARARPAADAARGAAPQARRRPRDEQGGRLNRLGGCRNQGYSRPVIRGAQVARATYTLSCRGRSRGRLKERCGSGPGAGSSRDGKRSRPRSRSVDCGPRPSSDSRHGHAALGDQLGRADALRRQRRGLPKRAVQPREAARRVPDPRRQLVLVRHGRQRGRLPSSTR